MRNFTLAIVLLITFSLTVQAQSSKTVINNINGYTFHAGDLETFSSIAFKDGKIVEVAFNGSEINTSNARVIDGNGQTMLPGLIDAHGHVMGLGYQELDINVAGISSLDETLQQVEEYAANNSDLSWIRGRGWNQTRWPMNEFPTAKQLDQAVSERPVWLVRVDGHAGWANSKAMEIAGINAETKSPEGGKIIRDEDGNPTGVFVDAAQSLIASSLPERTKAEQKEAFELALQQMRQHGLTGVHDAGVTVDSWEMYKNFADEGKLTTRIYGMIAGAGETFDELSAAGPIESYADDMLALRSIKLYADGALGSRGAAMLEPYSDDAGNTGLLFSSQKEMNRQVMKAASKGFQVNVHAIGDAANRQALNAFEHVKNQNSEQGLRHRVEHAQIIALKDIPRFKSLNIIASMQPTHATSDKNMAEDRVGSQRIEGGYAWQTLLDQGTVIASGSDFPVENVNPFYGLHSAITRQDHQGKPEGGWYSNEAMTRKQALRSFTIDAAYAAHQEEVLGSLEEGKWADFIIIDRDLFETEKQNIWQTKVMESWVAGEKVFDANQ